jgi:hypothetical protein
MRRRSRTTMAKKAAAAKKRLRTMSDEHKAALADGREQGRVVRRYLEALDPTGPRRGRKRTPESITKRLTAIDERLATADALSRLQLVQERMDLERELVAPGNGGADLDTLEAAFVEVAAAYGRRKGLTYEARRSIGVAPGILKAAGIRRGQ